MKKIQKTHLAPNHVTVGVFAQLLGVKRTHIYSRIENGTIETDLVGYSNLQMIDLNKYLHKDFEFKDHGGRQLNDVSKIKLKKA